MPLLPIQLSVGVLAQADAAVPREFQPYSLTHLAAIVLTAALVFVFARLGIIWRGKPQGRALLSAWVGFVALIQVVSIVFYAMWPSFDWGRSLPLEVCDLTGIIAVFALATQRRVLRVLLYYWGIGLSTQAFITPILHAGPETFRFWMFWVSHAVILASAVYDMAVNRFRPSWRDFGIITLAILCYGAAILPLDIAFDFDYGFIGNVKLAATTVVDFLGPWPLRLVFIFLIVETIFAVLTLVSKVLVRLGTTVPAPREDVQTR